MNKNLILEKPNNLMIHAMNEENEYLIFVELKFFRIKLFFRGYQKKELDLFCFGIKLKNFLLKENK